MALDQVWAATVDALRREFHRAKANGTDSVPAYSEGGRWQLLPLEELSSWTKSSYNHGNWMPGFLAGQMWLLADDTEDEEVLNFCMSLSEAIGLRSRDYTTHDLGFIFYPSHALPHRLRLLDMEGARPALEAAEMTIRRYNPRGRFIQAFGAIGHPRGAGTSTIDTMMNLPLLWWAAAEASMAEVEMVGRYHARTSARTFVRRDDSTYQLNVYDPMTGELCEQGTFQGADENSCWSRGQAWAVAGFAWAYAALGEKELLQAADSTARFYLRQLGGSVIPPWDFGVSDREDEPNDAGASAIVAVGTAILAWVHPTDEVRTTFQRETDRLLVGIFEEALNTSGKADGLVLNSCYSKPHGLGMDGATPWGDFYFCLALAIRRSASVDDVRNLLGLERSALPAS